MTQFERVTFQVAYQPLAQHQKLNQLSSNYIFNNNKSYFKRSNKKNPWTGNLRIGLTTKNPVTLTSSDLPNFSYPVLMNTDFYWITVIKSSYLRAGNKLSLVLDKNNSLQLSVNYVVKATLFGGTNVIPATPSTKLWLILDVYGNTNVVKFLPSGKILKQF